MSILSFKKITKKQNILFDEFFVNYTDISIISFNYNAQGAALCVCDGELTSIDAHRLEKILFGVHTSSLTNYLKSIFDPHFQSDEIHKTGGELIFRSSELTNMKKYDIANLAKKTLKEVTDETTETFVYYTEEKRSACHSTSSSPAIVPCALAFTDNQPAEGIGEESKMAAKTDLEKAQASIAKLEARAARADSIVDLNDNHRPYFKGLDTKGQDAFLAMSGDERSEAVSVFDKAKSDADPVIFKSADGTQYRKSDDPRMVKMAREGDENRTALRKAQEVAENATFVKRAEDELPNTPGNAEVGAAVLKALETIPEDDGLRGRAYLMVKAGDNALSGVFKRHGTTTVDPANDPASLEKHGASGKLDQIVKARMEKDSISEADAYVAVLDTPEGAALYDQATN